MGQLGQAILRMSMEACLLGAIQFVSVLSGSCTRTRWNGGNCRTRASELVPTMKELGLKNGWHSRSKASRSFSTVVLTKHFLATIGLRLLIPQIGWPQMRNMEHGFFIHQVVAFGFGPATLSSFKTTKRERC